MPKTTSKRKIKLTVSIKPAKLAEVTPRQRQQWKRWWSKLFSEIRDEVKSERKPPIIKPNGPAQPSGEMQENSDAQG